MKRPFRNNGLSLVLLGFFLAFWFGQGLTGWSAFNEELRRHGNAPVSFGEYLASAHFWEATGENWESEFLQMGAYVLLTCFLFQKGSSESKDPETSGGTKPSGTRHGFIYKNSLPLAFYFSFWSPLKRYVSGFVVAAKAKQGRRSGAHPAEWFRSRSIPLGILMFSGRAHHASVRRLVVFP